MDKISPVRLTARFLEMLPLISLIHALVTVQMGHLLRMGNVSTIAQMVHMQTL